MLVVLVDSGVENVGICVSGSGFSVGFAIWSALVQLAPPKEHSSADACILANLGAGSEASTLQVKGLEVYN